MSQNGSQETVSVKEAAARLEVGTGTIRKLIAQDPPALVAWKKNPTAPRGNSPYRITVESIEAFERLRTGKPAPEEGQGGPS